MGKTTDVVARPADSFRAVVESQRDTMTAFLRDQTATARLVKTALIAASREPKLSALIDALKKNGK